MKTCALSLVLALCVADDVAAIGTRRGTRNNKQTERRLKSSSFGGGKGGKGGKGKGKGGDFFYLSSICAPDSDFFGPGPPTGEFQKTCLTVTRGLPTNPNILPEVLALDNGTVGARCCGTENASAQKWRFNEVNEFYVTIQNEGTGECLQAPETCIVTIDGNVQNPEILYAPLDLAECNPGDDRFLFSVADLSITSKTCLAEGSLSSSIFTAGCTDGFYGFPVDLGGPGGPLPPALSAFSPASSVNSLTANCDVSICNDIFFDGACVDDGLPDFPDTP